MSTIKCQILTAAAFAPFGDVLDCTGDADFIINQGMCGRFHDRADVDFANDDLGRGQAGISLFNAKPRSLPYRFDMMERHPLGSQAFIPMHDQPFLVIVAENMSDAPHLPRAFVTTTGQAINIHRNVWHGVLTPLHAPGLFAVVDRIGEGNNLQEYWFDTTYSVDL